MSRDALQADCGACAGLCCVVPAFAPSSDFAIDKPAGVPCPHLADDFGCGVHDRLPELGFRGCTVYDCFGAGQLVVQHHFGGRDWDSEPGLRAEMFAAFEVVERLHELLWYLHDALARPAVRSRRDLVDEVEGLRARVEAGVATPAGTDVVALQLRADALLGEVSRAVRGGGGARHRGQDLAGRDLRGHDLLDADLRGALLIGADLRGLDLGQADLLGCDLRGADLRGADLVATLFWTRLQLRGARTDASTGLPS